MRRESRWRGVATRSIDEATQALPTMRRRRSRGNGESIKRRLTKLPPAGYRSNYIRQQGLRTQERGTACDSISMPLHYALKHYRNDLNPGRIGHVTPNMHWLISPVAGRCLRTRGY